MYIESEEALRQLYGFPKGRAKEKVLSELEKHSINFIGHSPLFTLSTYSKTGTVDCSPRGGSPGFVKRLNDTCILVPDAKGNNRLDSLINIVETGNVGCLFMIPGVDETLRINGTARISTKDEHLCLFRDEKMLPKTCIEITISEVFLHCAKAFMRSKLWDKDANIERNCLPTMGQMINDQLKLIEEPESQDVMLKRYEQDM